jgi:hypothetical protein
MTADLVGKPAGLAMAEAAATPLVALRACQKVLVHAGSGGVGAVAIQLAKHLGATPATTTGTGLQLGRITELTDSGGSARSSTGSTRSKRRTPPLPTSRRVAPRARSSCP